MATYRTSGWFSESYRHSLAARKISSGRGYFSKGNKEFGPAKAILAKPIGVDPVTGKLIYPTKKDLGIPYAPKKTSAKYDFSRPETQAELAAQLEAVRASSQGTQSFSMEQFPVVPQTVPITQELPDQERVLKPQAPIDESDMYDSVVQAEQEKEQGDAFDKAVSVGGAKSGVPDEMHGIVTTPGVSPVPVSVTESSAVVNP